MKRFLSLIVLSVAILLLAGCATGPPPAESVVTQPRLEEETEPPAGDAPPAPQTPTAAPEEASPLPDYEIVSLLPRDAIPAIFNPEFLPAAEADAQYAPDEPVLALEIDGDARAYSIPFLSGHEIVNDVVAGRPIAVTW